MLRRLLIAGAVLALLPFGAARGAARGVASAGDDPAATRTYWTPERLAAARSVSLLRIDLGARFAERAEFEAASAGAGYDRPPSAPSAGRHPDFDNFLFGPGLRASGRTRDLVAQPSSFHATNLGTAGQYFSSSRLIPEDARVVYPYSAVGKLFFSIGGSDFICSAAVISARVVATAGHCVFSAGRFHRNFLFVPAYHEGNAPFGCWAVEVALTTEAWMDGEDVVPNESDFGMLVMEDLEGSRLGDVTGWLGFKTNQLSPNHITMLGYPANLDRGEQMHQTNSSDWDSVDQTGSIVFGSDMGGGASGGPWVMNFGVKARGQNRGRRRLDNRIVGHSSFGSSDPNYLVLGSSPLDRTYRNLFDEACSGDSQNCRRKSKPQGPRN
jgi:hypothetical protein